MRTESNEQSIKLLNIQFVISPYSLNVNLLVSFKWIVFNVRSKERERKRSFGGSVASAKSQHSSDVRCVFIKYKNRTLSFHLFFSELCWRSFRLFKTTKLTVANLQKRRTETDGKLAIASRWQPRDAAHQHIRIEWTRFCSIITRIAATFEKKKNQSKMAIADFPWPQIVIAVESKLK